MVQEETNEQEEKKLSPEEIAERTRQLKEFYKERIPLLEEQVKYERLITEIDELRLRSLAAMIRTAELQAAPPKSKEK